MAMTSHRMILVVENDDSMREAIERLLGAAGFSTAGYASAEALLAGGAVHAALCIISDIRLPTMSGLELIGELRARGERLPVVVITAHDAPAVRNEAVRRGASAYLTKPFVASVLLAAIEGTAGSASPNQ